MIELVTLDLNQLKNERANLIARNGEIRKIKSYRRFWVFTTEVKQELAHIEQEEKDNQTRLYEIDLVLPQEEILK